jgi:hypothetical protein
MARPGRLHRKIGFPVAAAIVAAVVLALIVPALADGPSDPRASFFEGNVTSCADPNVGFPNSIQTEGDEHVDATVTDHDPEGQELNVTIDAGFTIDAVVVKGGNAYNVYFGNFPDMIAPLVGQGNVPNISHFFVCYHEGVPETTTTTTTLAPTVTTAGPVVEAAGVVRVQPTFTG